MWIPPEDADPIVLQAPTRKSVAFFGAVCERDGRLVTQQGKSFNADSFQTFLCCLLRHHRRDRKMIVIVDNARWHHACKLEPWLREHHNKIQLDFLPPYSPELNAIERVWKLTRTLCTHNQYFDLLEDLVDSVQDQFELWKKPNNILKRLCAVI